MPCFTPGPWSGWGFPWIMLLFPILAVTIMAVFWGRPHQYGPTFSCCRFHGLPTSPELENQRLRDEISKLQAELSKRGDYHDER